MLVPTPKEYSASLRLTGYGKREFTNACWVAIAVSQSWLFNMAFGKKIRKAMKNRHIELTIRYGADNCSYLRLELSSNGLELTQVDEPGDESV